MGKLTPNERTRRRALKLAKALDYNCDVCSAHEGHPCQNTGRARAPGTPAKTPHKCRVGRAFGYLALCNWASPGVAAGDAHLMTALAQSEWAKSTAIESRDFTGTCDKCDGPNDRANESNYCTKCSADFQARTLLNPECQPVGSK